MALAKTRLDYGPSLGSEINKSIDRPKTKIKNAITVKTIESIHNDPKNSAIPKTDKAKKSV
jgi:hypothetical protein